ncbi:TetR/AcrR family transcriptional regulator [uncultured Roseovarius sp.]|uniref:TetR/AcrR family transcriptional regulator n=1 Tax=uncultured Roseovarius sp. TaxID=293344 RepID=UPI00260CF4FB|nr:TetR/AcrR family transcriptional regulator [uncultured Roseovarius sp.]
MTSGLRERQKIDRSNRILDVARDRFQSEGYDAVTIESIAADANVSAVTVYNYYGTKANLLLALVKESDERLIAQLRALTESLPLDIREAVAEFGQIMRRHAMTYLTKRTWREVIASSILQGGRQFGQTYQALDRVLIGIMADIMVIYQQQGSLTPEIEAAGFADTLFEMQNIRFFQFVSDDDQGEATADQIFRRDVWAIFATKQVYHHSEIRT